MKLDRYWFGTEATLQEFVLQLHQQIKHGKAAYGGRPEDEEEKSPLLNKQGAVAVVKISGALHNGSRSYPGYHTAYNDIRNAMIQAAADPEVKAILLDINSGGGGVTGVSDTAQLIRTVDANVKPVFSYTDGMMASAAYWLGSSARKVYGSQMAELGSVGVITVHQSYARLMQEIGIDATVIRAGEFKALGHPLEPLSDKAKAEIQGQLDYMYGLFSAYVADRRNMTVENFDKTAGQGRVFIGTQAVAAGLSDGVTTFDALMSTLQAAADEQARSAAPAFGVPRRSASLPGTAVAFDGGGIYKGENLLQSGAKSPNGENVPNKQALTEQQVAALAEGAGAFASPEQAAAAAAALAASASAETPETAEAAAESAAPAAGPSAEVVALLQSQLAAAQAQVVELTVSNQSLQAQAEALKAGAAPLRAIAQASVDRMKVALGLPSGVAAASDEALLTEHASLRAQFEGKFKAGGVAAVAAPSANKGADSQPDPARQARIQATRLK